MQMETKNITDHDSKLDVLQLVPEDSDLLSQVLTEFNFNGDIDPQEFADKMYHALQINRGAGLSCNQVGINNKMFIIGYGQVRIDVFNPEVLSITGKDILMYEGCLSFPGMRLAVKRPGAIHVKYQSSQGKVIDDMFTGLTARIFLHEYDHMIGKTFKDKVSKFKWEIASKRREKLLRRIK